MSKGPWKKKQAAVNGAAHLAVLEKPSLGHLDPLQAAQDAARNAQEGNLKLAKAVEVLRLAHETICIAEIDTQTGLPVSTTDLRALSVEALDAYSAICGQSWRRAKLTGTSRAGDRNMATLGEQ